MAEVFEKRAGTTDRGKEYEHLYIANLVLKLVTDDTVEDFYLSSNDKDFGSFDDVVVTIKFCNKSETETYAIQLKQSKNKVLRSRDLAAAKGSFSIREYLEDYYKNLNSTENCIKLVLLTNCKDQIDENITTEINGDEIGVKMSSVLGEDLLSTYKYGSCCQLLPSVVKYEDFFQRFFLYTEQANVNQIETLTLKLFTEVFRCDSSIFKDFLNFVVKWSIKEGVKEKLSKAWMQQTIALCILSPCMRPLSFIGDGKISDKEQLFRSAVSKFHLTTLGRDYFEKIKNLWTSATSGLDLDTVNRMRLKYQIDLNHVQSVEDLSSNDKETNRLLWLLQKCPLVIKESQEVYEAAKLCKNLTFIVLTSDQQISNDLPGFENLSHLKAHGELYEEVLGNFAYSLESQRETELKLLVQIDEKYETLLSTDCLVQMFEGPLLIGRQEEMLPPCHVPRSLCKIVIDSSFLKQSNTSFILITGVPDFEVFGQRFDDLQIIDLESGVEINFPKKSNTNLIYLSRDEYSQEQFDRLCGQRTRRKNCYQFRYLSRAHLEWTRSCSVQEIKDFRLDYEYVHDSLSETDLYGNDENKINIVCANSGMGKSTLMKNLKASSGSSIWTLILCARNHFLSNSEKFQVDAFLDHVCDYNCKQYDDTEKQVFRTLMDRGKVRIVWDGLDEISKDSLDDILTLMRDIFKRGITQWVTARTHLRNILEERLQTFSRRIKEFDAEEQREYIQRRLNFTRDDLFALFKKIKTNVQPFSNRDIIGIPLQMYMLTELLLRDREKYTKLLDQSFSILDLYENFVSEKFNLYYEEKSEVVQQNSEKPNEDMRQKLECYKRVASGAYFKEGIFGYLYKLGVHFLEGIKHFGDPVGLITGVTNDVPQFVHNSLAEYFTALYLYDSDPYKAEDHQFVSSDDYNNIRFFLDLLLAQNSKAHLAILYRNSLLLDECDELELSRLDKIHRSVLELSCCWSHRYEIDKIQRMNYGRFRIHAKHLDHADVKKLQYTHDFTAIESVGIRLKKLLLLLPFLIPEYLTSVNDECAALLFYYSVTFDHVAIFCYLDDIPWLKKAYENFDPRFLLSVAGIYKSHNVFQKIISRQGYRDNLHLSPGVGQIFSFLFKHVIDLNELFFFACREGRVEDVRPLVEKGVRTNTPDDKGHFPLHYACSNEVDGFRITEYLILENDDANVLDVKKRLPLHHACMNTKFATAILAILNTNCLDILDIYCRTPLHYACDNEEFGYEIAEFLVMKNVQLDIPDIHNRTPMYYACMNWKFGLLIMRLLLSHGANLNTLDSKHRTPLHYACRNYHRGFDIVKLMADKGVDANLEDVHGRTPIQYACETAEFKTAKLLIDKFGGRNSTLLHDACKNYSHGYEICGLLIDKGSDVNLPDKDDRTPLHNACQFGKPETVTLLLCCGTSRNVQDVKKRLPFHYACMNIHHSSEIVQLLIDSSSRIGVLDIHSLLPIHYACKEANVSTVSLLIEKNPTQICIPDSHGRLPIHYACWNYNNGYEIIRLLVNAHKGANVGDEDHYGRWPIHYACETGNIYIVKLLLELGTMLDVRDRRSRTPLDCAQEARNYNVVQLLSRY